MLVEHTTQRRTHSLHEGHHSSWNCNHSVIKEERLTSCRTGSHGRSSRWNWMVRTRGSRGRRRIGRLSKHALLQGTQARTHDRKHRGSCKRWQRGCSASLQRAWTSLRSEGKMQNLVGILVQSVAWLNVSLKLGRTRTWAAPESKERLRCSTTRSVSGEAGI